MERKFLDKVYGYTGIKEELEVIYNWYKDDTLDRNKSSLLPKGILFYGETGEGKTHLAREYSKVFGYPIFVIEGNEENIQDEVIKAYAKAKQEKRAIVIIDELDRLIDDDIKLTRVLLAQLDGFDNTQNILTIATVNDYDALPEPLVREGRFDRHFRVSSNNTSDVTEMIKGFAKDSKVNLTQDEILELSDEFSYSPANVIKAIFNNVYLRYGENPSIKEIIRVADFLRTGVIKNDSDLIVTRYAAIHEAGHALFAYKYAPTKKFLRIYFSHQGGCTICKDINVLESSENRIDQLKVSLSGIVAEELLLGKHDIGCANDLNNAYDVAFRLMNRTCVNGIDNYCSAKTYHDRSYVSEKTKESYDKKTSKFILKNYKEVKRCLRKEKTALIKITDYLLEHKEINREEFANLVVKD